MKTHNTITKELADAMPKTMKTHYSDGQIISTHNEKSWFCDACHWRFNEPKINDKGWKVCQNCGDDEIRLTK